MKRGFLLKANAFNAANAKAKAKAQARSDNPSTTPTATPATTSDLRERYERIIDEMPLWARIDAVNAYLHTPENLPEDQRAVRPFPTTFPPSAVNDLWIKLFNSAPPDQDTCETLTSKLIKA